MFVNTHRAIAYIISFKKNCPLYWNYAGCESNTLLSTSSNHLFKKNTDFRASHSTKYEEGKCKPEQLPLFPKFLQVEIYGGVELASGEKAGLTDMLYIESGKRK